MATASLPMYDLPEVCNAHDTLWSVLAQNLRHQGVNNVPDSLAHGRPVATLWNDPDLLISQCCGYDIVHSYKDILRPIATPQFAAFGCLGENYCSTIVVINGPESHSGMSPCAIWLLSVTPGASFFPASKSAAVTVPALT